MPENKTDHEDYSFIVEETENGLRLDKFLSIKCDDVSRARLKDLVLKGQVNIDDVAMTTPSFKIKPGQTIEVSVPPAEEYEVEAENIPLDIVYEDDQCFAIEDINPQAPVHILIIPHKEITKVSNSIKTSFKKITSNEAKLEEKMFF